MSDIIKIEETSDVVKIVAVAGAVGYGLSGGFEAGETLAVSLSSATNTLASKTAVTAAYANLRTISLGAGTWAISANAAVGATTLGSALAASGIFGLRLHDGTNTLASTHGFVPRDSATPAAQLASSCLQAVALLASTTTISLQINGSTTLSVYHQEQGSGTTSGSSTILSAVRIA